MWLRNSFRSGRSGVRSKGDFNMKETSLRRVLGRTALGLMLLTTAVVTVWAAKNSNSAKTQSRPDTTIEQAVKAINGTWKLVKRVNSDGTEHAKVDGITTFDLQVVNSKLLGERAIGRFQA